jgi:integrase
MLGIILTKAKKSKMMYALVTFLLSAAARVQDAVGLKADVFLKHLAKARKGEDLPFSLAPKKTQTPRTCLISYDACIAISDYVKSKEINKQVIVFEETAGALEAKIRRYFKEEGVRSHDFRTTAATKLVLDVGIAVASKVLGHKNVNTTQGYAKISDKHVIDILRGKNEIKGRRGKRQND